MQVDTHHKNKGHRSHGPLPVTKTVLTTSWVYATMAAAVAATFWIFFASLDQLLFFSPILTFYLPEDAIANFVISSITAAILGIAISMNVYALNQRLHSSSSMKNIKKSKKIGITSTTSSLFSGSSLSILSTVCASCSSSLGLVLTSLFGTALGASVSTILSTYQTPLQIVSVVILLWSWYSISKSLSKGYCPIPGDSTND